MEQPIQLDSSNFAPIATYPALQALVMIDVEGVQTLQLNKVMVARGQTADRLSQDQALPSIRACVETSEAEGQPAPADTYLAAYVATEGSSEERKIRAMRATVQEAMEYLWR